MVWTTIPCKLFCKDKLSEHEQLWFHTDEVQANTIATAAKHTEVHVHVVLAVMEEQLSLQHQALRGALSCMYQLVI